MTATNNADGLPVTPFNLFIGATPEKTFQNVDCVTQLLSHLFAERKLWQNYVEENHDICTLHAPIPLLPDEQNGLQLIQDMLIAATHAAAEGVERH